MNEGVYRCLYTPGSRTSKIKGGRSFGGRIRRDVLEIY